MNDILTRITTESTILGLVLIIGIILIWREYKEERRKRIEELKDHNLDKEKMIISYEKLRKTLEDHTNLIIKLIGK